MRIAFYAPMKPPDHPQPSGDRRVARLLIAALRRLGHRVVLASRLRSYDGAGDAARQAWIARQGEAECRRLIAQYRALPRSRQPHLWFTYHLYHKAPDHLGARIADALDIPYVVAEASVARKQSAGPWAEGYRRALESLAAADVVLAMTEVDRDGLAAHVPSRRLLRLPPFLDPEPFTRPLRERAPLARRHGLDPARPWLLTVAMMRPGDKTTSYLRLAEALARLDDAAWQLLVVGDGPAAAAVRQALAPLGADRVHYAGALRPQELPAYYAASDIFVWPGVGEAYGMSYLEAQAAACPVVCGDEPGVRAVVRPGTSGVVVPPDDAAAFAAAVRSLLADRALRRRLGRKAQTHVWRRHGLDAAAAVLQRALRRAGP